MRKGAHASDTPTYTGPKEDLYILNRLAMRYWHKALLATPDVVEYVRSRGWNEPEEIAKRYQLGFAPGHGSQILPFVKWVQRRTISGFSQPDRMSAALVASGLAKTRDDGTLREAFTGRLMFPIATRGDLDKLGTPSARIAGFGGRSLPRYSRPRADGSEPPKYLNTSESPIFQKRGLLYGWSWGRGAARARSQAIICEGYMDYLRIREAGLAHNVFACCGTALTPEHVKLLANAKSTQRPGFTVVVMTDADIAGRRAADRGSRVVLDAGLSARIARFDGGKDPDDCLRDAGLEAPDLLAKIIALAETPVVTYLDIASGLSGVPPWGQTLDAFENLLRELRRRSAVGDTGVDTPERDRLVREDAERVAARLRLDGSFPVDLASMLDVLTSPVVQREQ